MNSNTFFDALYAKYCDAESFDIIELPQPDGHHRICEYVGFEKVLEELKNVSNLRWIDLSNNGISSLCESHQIDRLEQFTLKKAHSLHLERNLLENWTTVAKILELTPSLEELVLSSNPIRPPISKEIDEIDDKLNKLKVIVLGDVNYTWEDFLVCVNLWPNVEKLSLFENKIVHLDIPDQNFLKNLTFLSLSKNPISKWKEICKLGKLKNLETLELPNCKIESILFDEDFRNLFLKLKYLDLSYNRVNDWRSVAELSKLPKLNTLLVKRNPLFDTGTYDHNFNFILARVKNLVKLDREPVSKEARNDAEKYYLRMVYLEYLEKNKDLNARKRFLDENPCFLDLLEKLGEPAVAKKLTKKEMIQRNYLNLIVCDEQNPYVNKRRIQKQVPISIKVSNLKFILHRLLKIDMNQKFLLTIKSSNYEEEMQDRNDVQMYRIDEDAVIHVRRL